MGSKFGMAMRGRKETLFLPYRTTNTVIEYGPTAASHGRPPRGAVCWATASGVTS
jgi:hypothetical protein